MTTNTELKATNPEDYAQLEAPQDEIALVPMPSGAVFRMRRLDVQGMVLIGALPQSLVSTGLKAWKKQGKMDQQAIEQAVVEQDAEETVRQLIFYRQTVVENVLEPRIGYGDDGVVSLLNKEGRAIARLRKEDMRYAFSWITRKEGVEADGLDTFRARPERGLSTPVPDGAGLRESAVAGVTRETSDESAGPRPDHDRAAETV